MPHGILTAHHRLVAAASTSSVTLFPGLPFPSEKCQTDDDFNEVDFSQHISSEALGSVGQTGFRGGLCFCQ